ncbi:hypothetical protein AnigIFM56816_001162 [Aspergillus niger]|nr:hypothetical protein AnigIFM56816_001162 [Aspergillus niger]
MLASIDKGFKEKFGDTFHRQDAVSAPATPKKAKLSALSCYKIMLKLPRSRPEEERAKGYTKSR